MARKGVEMTTDSEYEANARKIAKGLGLTVTATLKGDMCPSWEKPCKHIHGDRYRVTLRFPQRLYKRKRSHSFDFWNSLNDSQEGKQPGYYDILVCVGSEATCPTDPDEVAREFGEMKPSQAIAIAKAAQRLQAFFTESEIDALTEIC